MIFPLKRNLVVLLATLGFFSLNANSTEIIDFNQGVPYGFTLEGGMSTFEGPMMAIKTVNALSHYTDWTVGHVHSGALGWVAMVSIGSLYHLIPVLFSQGRMYSTNLVNVHFWLATIGTVLYIVSMWISGVMQGLMWRAVNSDGTLTYSFVESLEASYPFYFVRFIGGVFFLTGMFIMAYNVICTVKAPKDSLPALAEAKE